MEAQQFEIENFTYSLPDDRIARYPLEQRENSKLLVFKGGQISEDKYLNLQSHLPYNSLLIFNDTKVVHARILFQNSNGAKIEIFCLEPGDEHLEPMTAMSQKGSVQWICLVGRAAKWKEPVLMHVSGNLNAEIIEKKDQSSLIKFTWEDVSLTFAEMLDQIGEMPIPPYLKRESEQVDADRYQTVYAKNEGSVAAPTAGLHFTPSIFESLEQKGIQRDYVTLHVGAGTFKPVKSKTLQDHEMHSEWIDVSIDTISNIYDRLSNQDKKIIAVGTTSLRTIESLYWMGVKAFENPDIGQIEIEVKQWNPYELKGDISSKDAIQALLNWTRKNNFQRVVCKTQLLIVPTYTLRIADALITNFHQPNSTLLLIVAAVTGESWRDIYDYALQHEFRFLSYGDGSLLFNEKIKN